MSKWREYDHATHGFTCPRCGRKSYHPEDARHGYCAACHDYTGGDVVKATMTTVDGKHVLVLGLTRENTKRLHDGLPIPIEVHEVDPRLPELTVLLMVGESEAAIMAELRAGTAQGGGQ